MPQICINHLSYAVPNNVPLFKKLSLTLLQEKTGLVGANGIGKSSLLKLILGELLPDSGSIMAEGNIAYCPQQAEIPAHTVVADMLSKKALAKAGLTYLDINRLYHSLSGGEKTRILITKQFSENADFIILDEPTNNLDSNARHFLYHKVQQWRKGLLIVSHDRTLLNLMDRIVELTTLGVCSYGGSYDYFIEQKALNDASNERRLFDAKKRLNKALTSTQTNYEISEQKKSHGRKRFLAGKIDKLAANSKRGRSERTQGRHAIQREALLRNAENQLAIAKNKIEIHKDIKIECPKTHVSYGKTVLKLTNVSFAYPMTVQTIIKDFNLTIVGPERIAILGDNGSGKTTLIKLILKEFTAVGGEIYHGIENICYVDQSINQLNADLPLLDNFLHFNPEINETDARRHLANFLFRKDNVLKRIKNLSGGEKLRALLACMLMSQQPPQLLILDEPTNHLDLDSIAAIESVLADYQGAMIVISHDEKFLENINIQRVIEAPFTS